MSKISLVYNVDTRKKFLDEYTSTADLNGGCCSKDFLTYGLLNKIEFLKPYELEVIVYIDQHEFLPDDILSFYSQLKNDGVIDILVIKQHTHERYGSEYNKCNNDLIYAECLAMATGDYVVHFDSDMIAYKQKDIDIISEYIKLLEKYKFVSLPSNYSPNCVNRNDDIWKNYKYMWASTRFFICKRDTIPPLMEMLDCFNNDYLEKKYGQPAISNCLEHILGIMVGDGNVLYPRFELDKYLIASWYSYYQGTLKTLNSKNYDYVKKYIMEKCGGIYGVGDVICEKIKGDINND